MTGLKREEQLELLALLEEKAKRERYNLIRSYFPDEGPCRRELYPKHLKFFKQGATVMQRGMISANQTGKTTAGCIEDVFHLTGEYPEWWEGARFTQPVKLLIGANGGKEYRDSIQVKLLGEPGDYGSGFIPKDSLIETRPLEGTTGAVGQYFVRHKSGGVSQAIVRTYNSGRTAFEAMVLDLVHLDEECPRDIYSECMMRLISRPGSRMYVTFTPDSGILDLVEYFEDGLDPQDKQVTKVTWDDVPHLTPEKRKILLAAMMPYEIDCRTKGIPFMGSGAIYPIIESNIVVEPFAIPSHWPKAYGMDVGWNRTAVIWAALDPESDILYLYSEHYLTQSEPSIHADAVKARGDWICGAIDPAANGSGQADGKLLLKMYTDLGLRIRDAENSVESGILTVWQRMSSGRLKVFSHLNYWQRERRVYRRDDKGKLVKTNDHLMDAMRYLVMSLDNVLSVEPTYDAMDEHMQMLKDNAIGSGRNSYTGY